MSSRRQHRQKAAGPLTLEAFVRSLEQTDPFRADLVHRHEIPEVAAAYSEPQKPLPDWLRRAVSATGIDRLYTHQTHTLDLARAGKNVVLVTPTASGKSLAFNLPVLEGLASDVTARALYLYPLKALEQDQLKRIEELMQQFPPHMAMSASIFDGDTPKTQRAKIRRDMPRILITNPDMLHYGIMPFHTQWETLFRSLRYLVIDEIHTYRGVFGSHILQVFRRIRRLCDFYGSSVQFIAASATIENPGQLAEALVGMPFEVVGESGAPQRRKHFLFFNPELSSYTEAARLLNACLEAGLKTIAFTRSRKITELLYTWCIEGNPRLKKRISVYRAGFLPEERRYIEQKLFAGELDGVISTSALEMGIDIGGLDACILVGYPGTITATWQRSGRVGRQDRESLIALIAGQDALDQYFMNNPDDFFDRPCERAVVDGDNRDILHRHLVCAAAEIPLRQDETIYDTARYAPELEFLVGKRLLDRSSNGKQWFATQSQPHRDLDIRSMGHSFTILDGAGTIIGTVSGRQRYAECHTGAVYLHRGAQYLIHDVDESQHIIRAQETNLDYYTMPTAEKETEILTTLATRRVAAFTVNQGRLKVTETITGYQRKRIFGQELIDQVPLSFPPMTFETIGIWIEIEEEMREILLSTGCHYMGSLHGIEHAALSLFPLFVLCDRNDVGGICKPHHEQVKKGAIFMYDGHAGGVGLAARAYDVVDKLLERTLQLISSCPCEEGCPSCIHSPKCGSGNKPLDKKGSILTLKILLDHELPFEVRSVIERLRAKSDEAREMGPSGDGNGGQAAVPTTPVQVCEPEKPAEITSIDMTELERQCHIVVFDLETQRSSHDVGGWGNSHLMRLSIGVVYDSRLDRFVTYTEETVDDLIVHLQQADLVVGFNSTRFDYAVLRGYSSYRFASLPSFDLCAEVLRASGKRFSLNNLATATLGAEKSADGLQALQWFKEGKLDLIARYCEQDVRITRDLFRFGLHNGWIKGAQSGDVTPVTIAVDWHERLNERLKEHMSHTPDNLSNRSDSAV